MVYLVTGKKNEGKTTRLRELFSETEGAWGFRSEKVHDCGRVTAYELTDMVSGETKTVARLASLPVPGDWDETIHHGPFLFNESAFKWTEDLLAAAVKAGAKAFFIDELGKLELSGSGLAGTVVAALGSGLDVYIAIRDINIDGAVKEFGIGDHKIITAGD